TLRISLLESASCSLWDVSADGSNLHRAALFPGENRDVCNSVWTHDGRYSVFSTFDSASSAWHLWALRETQPKFGSSILKPFELTAGVMSFWNAVPSSDGKHIFAVGGQTRGESVRYDLKTGRLEPFLSGIPAEHLDFSRDGKWVTYVTYP